MKFTPPHDQKPGLISSMLKKSYADLLESDEEHWSPEISNWERFDRDVFEHPKTVGSCLFLSWSDNQLIGFGSYDPRQSPEFGIVGHNCVLPDFQGRGFGKQQIREILRRFQFSGINRAKVSTNDNPFFIPAQRMYVACGFLETERHPWSGNPSQNVIEYEMLLVSTEFTET